MKTKNRLLALLSLLAEQSGETVTSARLEFTANKLAELDIDAATRALESLLESSRRFPTVAEIKEHMGVALPTQKTASLITARIIEGVSRFGSLQPCNKNGANRIMTELGEACWRVVSGLGGWNRVCETLGDNPSAARAQIRDYADAMILSRQIPGDKSALGPMRTLEAKNPATSEAIRKVHVNIRDALKSANIVSLGSERNGLDEIPF